MTNFLIGFLAVVGPVLLDFDTDINGELLWCAY